MLTISTRATRLLQEIDRALQSGGSAWLHLRSMGDSRIPVFGFMEHGDGLLSARIDDSQVPAQLFFYDDDLLAVAVAVYQEPA